VAVRIATNTCLDALRDKPRRVLPAQLGPASDPDAELRPAADLPWLQPYPDRLLDAVAPRADEPDAVVVARETIELAFLVAIQLLPPRQRAVLILRDVLGWSAKETAALLDTSVASANSALQRARDTLKRHLPARRAEWAASTQPTGEDRAVLDRYMEAFERSDLDAVAHLLREDARTMMPPTSTWFEGRDAILKALAGGLDRASPEFIGDWRMVPAWANRQPAAGCYLRRPGEVEYQAFSIDVLRVEDGQVAEITAFGPELFPAFGLPPTP
jgi:RNA polymerase sigma-70 factor (ECF subfamily)